MNDFTASGVPWYIAAATVLGIIACGIFLWVQASRKVKLSLDATDNTTGHVWDEDLKELNNPMPRWWMGLFYMAVVFGLGYLILFPGLAIVSGKLGWSSKGQYQQEVLTLEAQTAPLYAQFDGKPTEQLAHNPKALKIGQSLFLNNCAQCHGSDARGSKGYPNLTDADWLYGGSPDNIRASITQGRNGMMPSMMAAIGGEEKARQVAQYVMSLSGRESDQAKAQLGRTSFTQVCAACHGAEAKGNHALGAPNLTDRIWLHGGTEAAIVETIRKGRSGVMPAHETKLTRMQIDVLTAYVWGLSNAPVTLGQSSGQ